MSEPSEFTTTLRIMSTSDVHGQMLNYDYFAGHDITGQGLIATATLIEQARREQPLNLLVENGDLIQGSALADYVAEDFPIQQQTHPIIAMLNALEYDVANLGNHEFNFGLDFLAASYSDAQFPVVASNLVVSASAPEQLQNQLQRLVWIEREVVDPTSGARVPLSIAVIGVTPPQIMQWDQHHLQGRVSADGMLSTTQFYAKQAREQGADVVVLAAHTGMPKQTPDPEDKEQTGWLLAGVAGIDALLLGHQHEVFPGTDAYNRLPEVDSEQGRVRGVPAVQPGAYGSHLGIIDLPLSYQPDTGWQVLNPLVSVRAVTADTPVAHELKPLLNEAHAATLKFMQQPVGSIAQPLSYRTARWEPSSAVQFVQRAQGWRARQLLEASGLEPLPLLSAAAPFAAAFSPDEAATKIAAGELQRGAIGDLYRYPNTLDVVAINGAQLRDWLEYSARGFNEVSASAENCWAALDQDVPHYNFDSILGVSYVIDIRKPVGKRVVSLTYNDQPVSEQQRFYVATNNYRANGGGDFPHLDGDNVVLRGADMLADVLLSYLRDLPGRHYDKAVNKHWQVIGCGGRI
ncbi:bifunctional 2',3'-cyclic-nucleotide 2'-phosphodiesterase/3'-nucleotidase [Pseudidiomarina insulisalsae]|nr:bifunctional 2',3'-cyclic-nucleotide 2'-phosphodiesterase/3'-nucleotidase [Pseudidiomarina insulisalsae]